MSAAAPSVTGIIALMLQANPSLDAAAGQADPPADRQARLVHGSDAEHDVGLREGRRARRGRAGPVDDALRRAARRICALPAAGSASRSTGALPAQERAGSGTAVPLTGDTGYFWFFSATQHRARDQGASTARAVNEHFWVFYGALSNVQYTIIGRRTPQTGDVKVYDNASGHLASVADTDAFTGSIASPSGTRRLRRARGVLRADRRVAMTRATASFEDAARRVERPRPRSDDNVRSRRPRPFPASPTRRRCA